MNPVKGVRSSLVTSGAVTRDTSGHPVCVKYWRYSERSRNCIGVPALVVPTHSVPMGYRLLTHDDDIMYTLYKQ